MYGEDFLAALSVCCCDNHLPVKASGAEQGRVKDIGTVGGGNDDNAFVGLKAVHFHQQLVQGLFPFIVACAKAGTSFASHGVNFVDKDDAGGVLLALLKEVADTGSTDADKHFHKV